VEKVSFEELAGVEEIHGVTEGFGDALGEVRGAGKGDTIARDTKEEEMVVSGEAEKGEEGLEKFLGGGGNEVGEVRLARAILVVGGGPKANVVLEAEEVVKVAEAILVGRKGASWVRSWATRRLSCQWELLKKMGECRGGCHGHLH
jgi:hypothetical protein